MEYTKEDIQGLHDVSLDMAKYFVDFCNKHDLLCYMCGGGCIGAIRHKGFIPWDDDLDFFMPRKDYEKLIVLWNDKANIQRYPLSNSTRYYNDRNLFVSIRDANTTQVKPYQEHLDVPHGVALDVFPLDGYPKGAVQRKLQCTWALIFSLYRSQIIPSKHGAFKKYVSKLLLFMIPSQTLKYYIWNFAQKQMIKYEFEDCEHITELCAGPGYMKNKYQKESFMSAIFVEFEDTTLPIPIGYDSYLKIAFGDYMKLPPIEKQKPHHDSLKLDLHKSYKT